MNTRFIFAIKYLIYLLGVHCFLSCNPKVPCSNFDPGCSFFGYAFEKAVNDFRAANTPGASTQNTITFSGASSLTILSSTSVKLAWTAATSTSSASSDIVYNVYMANSTGAQVFTSPLTTTSAGATSVTISGITASTDNYYVVRAKDTSGKEDTNTEERAALLNGLIRFIPLDSTGLTDKIGGNAVTAIGSPSLNATDRKGVANNAYTLNGSTQNFTFNQTLPTALPIGDTDRTICAWGKMTSISSIHTLVGWGTAPNTNGDFKIQLSGGVLVSVYDQNGNYSINSPDYGLTYSNWNFYCFSYKSGGGFSFASNANYIFLPGGGPIAIILTLGYIGVVAGGGGDYFPGFITEVSIWNRRLSQAELLAVYKN